MQREIGDEIHLGVTVSPFKNVRDSSAIGRTASNYNNAKEKVKKIRELIKTGKYDAAVVKYIPGTFEMVYQAILEDIDTKEKVAHSSYRDMEQLDFQIMLTDNYYANSNSIHFCFPMKINKGTNMLADTDSDMIAVNNFLVIF